MRADLLANVERHASERPAPLQERVDPQRGYWPGSAVGHVQHWRARALAVEAELQAVLAEVAEQVRRRACPWLALR